MLIDGVGSDGLGSLLVAALTEHARPAVHVRAEDFWRPAGERFTWGREDAQAFRETWLDVGALRREVLDAAAGGSVLPRLWDAERDRSARAAPVVLTDRSVVVVTGVLLLGRDLPSELTVHLSLSPAALLRRGIPSWQVPAFTSYDGQVDPARISDVLVLAEDPQRLAVRGD